MFEVLVLVLGAAIGFALRDLHPRRAAVVLVVCLSMVAGTLVTVISGEAESSFGFFIFDAGQAAVAGLLTYAFAQARAGRRAA